MKKLIFLVLLVCPSIALAGGLPSIIKYYNAASGGGGGGITWDTGNLFSETFGTTGSDGADNTPDNTSTEGTYTADFDSQDLSVTGFEGDHADIEVSSGSKYEAFSNFGSTEADVWGRFIFYVESHNYAAGTTESIFALDDGGHVLVAGGADAISFEITNNSGQLQLTWVFAGGASVGTGSTALNISEDTPYRVEFGWDATNGEVTVWVDDISSGIPESPTERSYRGGLTMDSMTEVGFGISYNGSYGANIYIDRIDLDTSGRIVDE